MQVSRPEEVAEPGGILITSLSNDQVLEEVAGANRELLRRLGPGGIHVSTSTVAPATSRRLAENHKPYGVTYLASGPRDRGRSHAGPGLNDLLRAKSITTDKKARPLPKGRIHETNAKRGQILDSLGSRTEPDRLQRSST